jgi:acyl dehydratase
MPLNRDLIGRSYGGTSVYEVSRAQIQQFATAIGDANPAYVDTEAARSLGYRDVIAPPTFLSTLALDFETSDSPIADPELGLDFSMVVHGEQRTVQHRPASPGDRLLRTTVIEGIRDLGPNEMLRIRTDLTTEQGELVCEIFTMIISRGTAAPAT